MHNEEQEEIQNETEEEINKLSTLIMESKRDFETNMNEMTNRNQNWIYQIVTIAGAIIAGFVLSKDNRNFIDNIALSIIFFFNFISLITIYIYNRNMEVELEKDYRQHSQLHFFSLMYLLKKKTGSKTRKDKELMTQYEKGMVKVQKELFSITPEQIEEMKHEKKPITINISLISLIFTYFAIIILIFSDHIIKLF